MFENVSGSRLSRLLFRLNYNTSDVMYIPLIVYRLILIKQEFDLRLFDSVKPSVPDPSLFGISDPMPPLIHTKKGNFF